MNIILALFVAFARPYCPPVTSADIERALALERSGFAVTAGSDRSDRSDNHPDHIPGRFVAGFEPGRLNDLLDWLGQQGGGLVRVDSLAGFLVCSLPDAVGRALSAQPLPASARWFEPDISVRASHLPNDHHFLTHQWDKWVMYADRAWDITRGSPAITVAVCDNGIEYTHPDLVDRFTPGAYGYDFVNNDTDPKPDDPGIPQASHGTHVAGIIAATMDNGIGVAGWAGVRLLAVKVLNDSGSGTMSGIASGIRWATDNGARIINMSLGGDAPSTVAAEAAAYAASRNVLIIAAAGNAGAGTVQYPARLPEVVCVGATDSVGGLAYYSNYGYDQEVVAPGSAILSCWTNAAYALSWGTSMAAPQVTGVAALIMAANPALSATRVRAVLTASALIKGKTGWNQHYGYGIANAWRAVTLATMMTDGPAPLHLPPGNTVRHTVGTWSLPDWAETAEIYDVAGRGRKAAGREINLTPGTWFIRLKGPGRTEFVRLSVVR